MESQNKLQEVKVKKITANLVLKWIVGVLLVIIGILRLFSEFLFAISSIFIALLILPPVSEFIKNKYNIVISRNLKIIIIIGLFALMGFSQGGGNTVSTEPITTENVQTKPVVREINITEAQCQKLKDEFYSLITQEPFNKTQLGKELLEQYASNAGIPVKKSDPNVTYTLPKSECGRNLDTALDAIIQGEKKSGGF